MTTIDVVIVVIVVDVVVVGPVNNAGSSQRQHRYRLSRATALLPR